MTYRRKRILVVDDDEQILIVWRGALEKYADRWSIETALNGYEALELVRKTTYDLIVTDLRMPMMDGCELTVAIRHLAGDVPVVWITAYPEPDIMARAAQLSVSRFLSKPLPVDQIRQVVLQLLGNES